MTKRNLVAVSIKHTLGDYYDGKRWKFGMPFVLWGSNRTKDDEERSFSGYTRYLNHAELYSLSDWEGKYQVPWMKTDEPVKLSMDICKKFKQFDTVLVLLSDLEKYYDVAGLYVDRSQVGFAI